MGANHRIWLARAAFAAALAAPLGGPAHGAPDEAMSPGPLVPPPSPPPPAATAPLETNDAQRRAVRGCSVDNDCRDPRAALREFELEAFPRPGSSPWLDSDDPMGHEMIRTRGAHGPALDRPLGSQARPRSATAPLELRPDLPWLAELELPDLAVRWDERVIRYLEFYKSDPRGRSIMSAWLRAQGTFYDLIVRELREADLPEALLYVAMIESSYDVHEYSRVGASGLWQFMPGTARIYGLTVNRWVDERNDPVKSTKAAVLMFQDLYQRFGDWNLALAAYNTGYGNVTRSICKYNTNDFWQLIRYEAGLPWASQLYVPKALATAIVGMNRERFGFADVSPAPPYAFETVTVPTSVPFSVIARAAGTTAEEIARLNPHLRRKRTPPADEAFTVRIPQGRRALFAERFPQLRGDWDRYDAYVVRHGERFEDIATTHGISYDQLLALNGVDDEAEIGGGVVIVVPRVSEDEKRANRRKADEDLYRSGVPRGTEDDDGLIVAVPDRDALVEDKRRFFYRVVAGDSLWSVSRAFRVSVNELAAYNGLDPDAHLQARMVLQVWTAPSFDPADHGIKVLDDTRIHLVTSGSVEHIELTEGRVGRRRTLYTVKHGGTFEDVGRIYGLSKYDIARINRKPPNTRLGAGDEVIVYEVVDHTKSKRAQQQAQRARKKPPSKRR